MRGVIETLRCHLDHTVAIDLSGYLPPPDVFPIEDALSSSAPILESLAIERLSLERAPPSQIRLGDDAPRLREVKLIGVGGTWVVPGFAGLTHLHIHVASIYTGTSYAHFLDTLERSPGLQDIDITFAPPHADRQVLPRRIELPRLKRLRITAPPSDCVTLLTNISTPATTFFAVFASSSRGSEDDYNALFSALTSKFQALDTPFRALVLQPKDSDINGGALFEASRDVDWFDGRPRFDNTLDDGSSSHIPLTLEISPPESYSEDCDRSTTRAIERLPLLAVEVLSVKNAQPDVSGIWENALSRLKHVQHLELESCDLLLPLSALSLTTSSQHNISMTCFPRLKSLQINRADFTRQVGFDNWGSYERLLLNILDLRKRYAVPIQWLCFRGCRVSEGTLAHLRDIVPKVLIEHPRDLQ